MNESVSPDLQQTVKLVRPDNPSLQFRTLTAGAPVTAVLQLPDDSRPILLPVWHPSGSHIALLYAVVTDSSMTLAACVVRMCDQAMQKLQIENLPPDSPRPHTFELPIAWAPHSPTLLVCRTRYREQQQTCFRCRPQLSGHPPNSSTILCTSLNVVGWTQQPHSARARPCTALSRAVLPCDQLPVALGWSCHFREAQAWRSLLSGLTSRC